MKLTIIRIWISGKVYSTLRKQHLFSQVILQTYCGHKNQFGGKNANHWDVEKKSINSKKF